MKTVIEVFSQGLHYLLRTKNDIRRNKYDALLCFFVFRFFVCFFFFFFFFFFLGGGGGVNYTIISYGKLYNEPSLICRINIYGNVDLSAKGKSQSRPNTSCVRLL